MARSLMFKDDEEAKYFDKVQQMEENSRKWHETDDQNERDKLHFQNQVLSGELDLIDGGNRTFDKNTGAWSTDYGNKNQTGGQWQPEDTGYKSKYGEEAESLLGDIAKDKFSYNPNSDPSYKAYENLYQREGDRASKSTLADISAAQGGISSYAASAAQQASNAYATALTDKIPELEELAYQKFLGDRSDKYNRLNALLTLDDIAYGRYNDDKSWDYQKERDKKSDEMWQTEFDFNKDWQQKIFDNDNYWRDIDQSNWQSEFDFNKEWQEKEFDNENYWRGVDRSDSQSDRDYDKAMTLIKNGVMPDESYLGGLTPQEARALYARLRGGASSSSGGSSGGSGGKKSTTSTKSSTKSTKKTTSNASSQASSSVSQSNGEKSEYEKSIDKIYDLNQRGVIPDDEAKYRLMRLELDAKQYGRK